MFKILFSDGETDHLIQQTERNIHYGTTRSDTTTYLGNEGHGHQSHTVVLTERANAMVQCDPFPWSSVTHFHGRLEVHRTMFMMRNINAKTLVGRMIIIWWSLGLTLGPLTRVIVFP